MSEKGEATAVRTMVPVRTNCDGGAGEDGSVRGRGFGAVRLFFFLRVSSQLSNSQCVLLIGLDKSFFGAQIIQSNRFYSFSI